MVSVLKFVVMVGKRQKQLHVTQHLLLSSEFFHADGNVWLKREQIHIYHVQILTI